MPVRICEDCFCEALTHRWGSVCHSFIVLNNLLLWEEEKATLRNKTIRDEPLSKEGREVLIRNASSRPVLCNTRFM